MTLHVVTFFLFSFCLSPTLARLQKRGTPRTLNIPLVVKDNRYAVTVNMSTAPKPQTFAFALSTSTGYIMVAGTDCNSCSGVPAYNTSASISAKSLPGAQSLTILDGSASGNLIKENCSLLERNGSAWAYPNQTIIVANQSNSIFSPGISGILGLGTNAGDGNFADTVFGGWLSRNPSRSNFSYGMALNAPQNDSTDGGFLDWLSPDTSAYQGDISWKSVVAGNLTSTNSDWTVELDSFSFSTSNGLNISDTYLKAIVDPYYPNIYIPQTAAHAIYGSIPGASLQVSSTDSISNVWTVPCDTTMRLVVTFGTLSIAVAEDALIRRDGSSCTSLIEEWTDYGTSEYMFGATFISAIYLIFTISGPSLGSIGFAARSFKPSISSGAIVGITLGSLAVVTTLVVAVILVWRTKRKARSPEGMIHPFFSYPRREEESTALLIPLSPTSPDPRQSRFVEIQPPSSANSQRSVDEGVNAPINADVDVLAPPPPYSSGPGQSLRPLPSRPTERGRGLREKQIGSSRYDAQVNRRRK